MSSAMLGCLILIFEGQNNYQLFCKNYCIVHYGNHGNNIINCTLADCLGMLVRTVYTQYL